jgi:gas vesicle protein
VSELGKFDPADWVALAVTSMIAGMGAAMGWFSKSNKARDERIQNLEEKVEQYKDLVIAQATSLAVMQACQSTIQQNLSDIKTDIKETAIRGARSVNEQLAMVMNEVQKIAHRRHD